MRDRRPSPPPKRKRQPIRRNVHAQRQTEEWGIILIDQEPLRKEAAQACTDEMARLESLRSEWQRFETEDQPLFSQWLMQTFGSLLTELRESDRILREREALIREIEAEVYFGGARNYRAAFKAVMARRATPQDDTDPSRGEDQESTDSSASEAFDPEEPVGFEEAEALFRDYLQKVLDIHPNQLRKAEYAKLFAAFQRDILGQEPAQKTPPAGEKPGAAASADPSTKSRKNRIKEIYRILVRKLHPDTKSEPNKAASGLWHEVQSAYEKGDLERLEMLLALSETTTKAVSSTTSLSQMRRALQELRRSSQAMLRSLSQAKKDIAWNFTQLTNRAPLEARLKRQFQADREHQLQSLDQIEDLLAEWSYEPKPRKPRNPRA